jgi:hypothetical protein
MSWNLMLARSNAFEGSERSIALSMLMAGELQKLFKNIYRILEDRL